MNHFIWKNLLKNKKIFLPYCKMCTTRGLCGIGRGHRGLVLSGSTPVLVLSGGGGPVLVLYEEGRQYICHDPVWGREQPVLGPDWGTPYPLGKLRQDFRQDQLQNWGVSSPMIGYGTRGWGTPLKVSGTRGRVRF